MGEKNKLLFITDLDATLLTHDYSWSDALPALSRIRRYEIPLVLNSSKTISELENLANELNLNSPIIAENGGLLALKNHTSGGFDVEITGTARTEILQVAHALRQQKGYQFEGFADWSAQQVAARTQLSIEAAERACSRIATEPISWNDSATMLEDFTKELADRGIRVVRGGSFLHLMGPADKADGAAAALRYYQHLEPDEAWTVVALGDSANDLKMLEAADIAVVIPHDDGPHISPKATRVIHAPFTASKGWNAAVLSLINEFY